MSFKRAIGWGCYETIQMRFANFNFNGYECDEALRLVQEGKGRWAYCHGNTLTFVENNYKLKELEYFLQHTSEKGFEFTNDK